MKYSWFPVGCITVGWAAGLSAQVEEAWRARYDVTEGGDGVAGDLALDDSGNVYVAGVSSGLQGITVAKYNPEGNLLWISTCDANPIPTIAVDATGNAYVAGIAYSADWPETHESTLIISKLDPEGRRIWQACPWQASFITSYETAFGEHLQRPALAIDASGNVHVAALANSGTSQTCQAELTIFKYDAEGSELWADILAVAVSDMEFIEYNLQPVSTALDEETNVYTAAGDTLVKHDASGNRAWEISSGWEGRGGDFTSMAVDRSGVFVTESIESSVYLRKYDDTGCWVWETDRIECSQETSTFSALAADPADGSVYLTGPVGEGDQCAWATLKYDGEGQRLWERCIGPICHDGRAMITIGRSGSVHVTVSTSVCGQRTVKFGRDGNQLWTLDSAFAFGSPSNHWMAQAADARGNVYLTGCVYAHFGIVTSSSAWVTVKYDASATKIWTAHYDGSGGVGYPTALAIDAKGNVFVTGNYWSYSPLVGSPILKYSSTGTLLWRVYEQVGFNSRALAADAAGNVYVTGISWNIGSYDTVKYAPDGTVLWRNRHDGVQGLIGNPTMALGPEDTVYVAASWAQEQGRYATLVKSDQGGQELWAVRSDEASPNFLAVDGDGNAYVAGEEQYPIIKYDRDGHEVWRVLRVGRTFGLALDPAGNLIVTGESGEVGIYETIKYAPDGNELWITRFLRKWDWNDASALAVDSDGSVYVAGRGWGDYPTVKYTPDGNEVWLAGFNAEPSAIALDAAGGVYVAGFTPGINDNDFYTVKYAQTPEAEIPRFRRGDATGDGRGDLSDAIVVLDFLFCSAVAPACMDAADSDDSGVVNITDPIYLLQHLFLGGAPPPEPGLGACGPDRTLDRLEACAYPAEACGR